MLEYHASTRDNDMKRKSTISIPWWWKRVDTYSNKTIYGKYQKFWSYKSTVGMIVMQGDRNPNPCPR